MIGIIYKITSPSGRVYIGQTRNFKDRMQGHKDASKGDKNTILGKSIRKYGWDNHSKEILVQIDNCTRELLNDMEAHYVRLHCSFVDWNKKGGLNLTIGGDNNCSISELTIKKLRDINLGRKHTEESKQKMSATRTGRKHTEESKKNISNGHKNSPLRAAQQRGINVYDKNMNLINTFKGMRLAAKELGLDLRQIYNVCKSPRKTVNGIVLRYADGEQFKYTGRVPRKDSTMIIQKDYLGNIINEFETINDAVKKTGFKSLWFHIVKGRKNDYGFKWERKLHDS